MKKVFIVGHDYSVETMFLGRGYSVEIVTTTNHVGNPDFVVFTGGADIQPHLYGEENTASHCNPGRDAFEIAVYEKYKDANKLGICRGMQLLNILNGGKMIQDIKGHTGRDHPILDIKTGKKPVVTTCHHQMCVLPNNNSFELVARSLDELNVPEAVFIHSDKALGVQGHPEWGRSTEEYFFELIKRYYE